MATKKQLRQHALHNAAKKGGKKTPPPATKAAADPNEQNPDEQNDKDVDLPETEAAAPEPHE